MHHARATAIVGVKTGSAKFQQLPTTGFQKVQVKFIRAVKPTGCRRLGLIHQAVNPNNAITFGTRDIFEQKVGCVGVEMVGFAACFMINARALPAKLIHKHLISQALCGDQISRISRNAHREFGGWIRQVRDFQQFSVGF
jgi:hypothetical protein